ncbi:MAG: hypothetical protein ROO71_12675 [Balneola sp.]
MKYFLLIILCFLFLSRAEATDCVILLHGLARSDHSLSKLEQKLSHHGYFVVNESYPSTEYDIETLTEDIIPESIVLCPDTAQIHFVTHSLGGILVRQYLSNHTIQNLSRVVMLAPPNKGSEITDELKDNILYQTVNGPAGLQLGTDSTSVPNRLGSADFELGIIAGTKTVNPILSQMLPNPDDGKVSVESTKLEGMADHLEVPYSHTFIMNKDEVIEQIIHFLEKGSFKHPD